MLCVQERECFCMQWCYQECAKECLCSPSVGGVCVCVIEIVMCVTMCVVIYVSVCFTDCVHVCNYICIIHVSVWVTGLLYMCDFKSCFMHPHIISHAVAIAPCRQHSQAFHTTCTVTGDPLPWQQSPHCVSRLCLRAGVIWGRTFPNRRVALWFQTSKYLRGF